MNTIQIILFILLWFCLGGIVGWAAHKIVIDEKDVELDRICNATVIKDHGFNYLKFDIISEKYSDKLDKYPNGTEVVVYAGRKHLKK